MRSLGAPVIDVEINVSGNGLFEKASSSRNKIPIYPLIQLTSPSFPTFSNRATSRVYFDDFHLKRFPIHLYLSCSALIKHTPMLFLTRFNILGRRGEYSVQEFEEKVHQFKRRESA